VRLRFSPSRHDKPEHLRVGKPARFVALQYDAAATRHQRDVVELDDQHPAVVADKGDRVAALGLNADAGNRSLTQGQHLLAARVCATASSRQSRARRFRAATSTPPVGKSGLGR